MQNLTYSKLHYISKQNKLSSHNNNSSFYEKIYGEGCVPLKVEYMVRFANKLLHFIGTHLGSFSKNEKLLSTCINFFSTIDGTHPTVKDISKKLAITAYVSLTLSTPKFYSGLNCLSYSSLYKPPSVSSLS